MTLAKALFCVLLLGLLVPGAFAQTKTESAWGKPADLKPLLPPIVPPLLPPNATVTPGTVGGGPYSGSPVYGPSQSSEPRPGLSITIPTR